MIRIREAERRDLGAAIEAIVALNRNGTAADPRYRLAQGGPALLREHLEQAWFGRFLPFPACLLAEEEGGLVGLVAGEVTPDLGILESPPTVRIDSLWVAPERRRRGVGRALVEAFRERAGRAGFPRLKVGTLVRDARAVAFWQAMGFEPLTVILATDYSGR